MRPLSVSHDDILDYYDAITVVCLVCDYYMPSEDADRNRPSLRPFDKSSKRMNN